MAQGTAPEAKNAFIGFVLLAENTWDPQKLAADLLADWGIATPADAPAQDGQSLTWEEGGRLLAVSLMPAPVPNGEAEQNAANNYRWPEAAQVTGSHTAHLLVAVLGRETPHLQTTATFVEVCAACLKQPGALGLFSTGTVYRPDEYIATALRMREDEFPLANLVYFGLYRADGKLNGYTYGLAEFGKKEIEVLQTGAQPGELYGFLYDIASYIVLSDVVLLDGETIGFSEEQKLSITLSKGVALPEETLKISCPF